MNMEIEKDKHLDFLDAMRTEIGKRIKGYSKEIDLVLVALAASGHVLYTGYPGLAKTLLTTTVAEISGCTFSHIQLTADMLPADIIGFEKWLSEKQDLEVRWGPIVAQIVLADEINRAQPRTQSAFIEAMQEGAVTLNNVTKKLGPPFFVFATRNPIEQEGVYPLPEAQLDRFLFEIVFPYPKEKDEINIARQGNRKPVEVEKVGSPEKLISLADFTSKISISEEVNRYAVALIRATREHGHIRLGASPRSSQKLVAASKAHALVIRNETWVTPYDVDAVLEPLLMPRLILKEDFSTEYEDGDIEIKKGLISEIKETTSEHHISRN